MKPRIILRGGRASDLKPDSLRTVAISTGTGMPYLRSALLAERCQFLTQPSFCANTAQTSLMRLGCDAQPASASSAATAVILLK